MARLFGIFLFLLLGTQIPWAEREKETKSQCVLFIMCVTKMKREKTKNFPICIHSHSTTWTTNFLETMLIKLNDLCEGARNSIRFVLKTKENKMSMEKTKERNMGAKNWGCKRKMSRKNVSKYETRCLLCELYGLID